MRFLGTLFLGIWLVGGVAAQAPKIVVHPERIDLAGPRARHGILVTAVAADGTTRDISADAKFLLRRRMSKSRLRANVAGLPMAPHRSPCKRSVRARRFR